MRVRIIIAIGLLSLCVATLSFAYDEPDNFAGVKFGEDVTTQLPNCRESSAFRNKLPCWEELVKDERGDLKNMGEIQNLVEGIFYTQVEKKLEYVLLEFRTEKARALLDIFKRRYGEPTSVAERPWQSKGGVKTTSIHAEWAGPKISIIFEERGSSIDRGSIQYITATMMSAFRHKREEQRKKAAGGL
jgi:hypothetical protein